MLKRILVPLDGSPAMARVIPALRGLVHDGEAVVHLLLVRPPVRPPEPPALEPLIFPEELLLAPPHGGALVPGARSYSVPQVPLDELMAREHADGEAYLRRVGSQLAYDGVRVRGEVQFGNLLAEVLRAAARHAIHVIALTHAPRAGWRRLLRPGLAQALLTQSPVPVLHVPDTQWTQPTPVWRVDRVPV
jgi:nucleotide-binding universal stress UspA family protein